MALIVPLQAVPNQTLTTLLANQNCRINVYQNTFGVFFDLAIGNVDPICLGVKCENGNRLVRYAYLGLVGDFFFVDTQGDTDPVYAGLGSRYLLVYLEASDLA